MHTGAFNGGDEIFISMYLLKDYPGCGFFIPLCFRAHHLEGYSKFYIIFFFLLGLDRPETESLLMCSILSPRTTCSFFFFFYADISIWSIQWIFLCVSSLFVFLYFYLLLNHKSHIAACAQHKIYGTNAATRSEWGCRQIWENKNAWFRKFSKVNFEWKTQTTSWNKSFIAFSDKNRFNLHSYLWSSSTRCRQENGVEPFCADFVERNQK